jgi:hypothetical protein
MTNKLDKDKSRNMVGFMNTDQQIGALYDAVDKSGDSLSDVVRKSLQCGLKQLYGLSYDFEETRVPAYDFQKFANDISAALVRLHMTQGHLAHMLHYGYPELNINTEVYVSKYLTSSSIRRGIPPTRRPSMEAINAVCEICGLNFKDYDVSVGRHQR